MDGDAEEEKVTEGDAPPATSPAADEIAEQAQALADIYKEVEESKDAEETAEPYVPPPEPIIEHAPAPAYDKATESDLGPSASAGDAAPVSAADETVTEANVTQPFSQVAAQFKQAEGAKPSTPGDAPPAASPIFSPDKPQVTDSGLVVPPTPESPDKIDNMLEASMSMSKTNVTVGFAELQKRSSEMSNSSSVEASDEPTTQGYIAKYGATTEPSDFLLKLQTHCRSDGETAFSMLFRDEMASGKVTVAEGATFVMFAKAARKLSFGGNLKGVWSDVLEGAGVEDALAVTHMKPEMIGVRFERGIREAMHD